MTWKEFTYLAPTSLDEAIGLLAERGSDARVLAGGTDLVLRLKAGQWRPRTVINIKRIPGLDGIDFDPTEGLRLGALVTAADLARSETVRSHYPALAQGARAMASVQIRNLATVGGNLCNAAPSADLAPPLIVLGGSAVIAGSDGQRQISLDEFFLGPGQTVLASGELLIAITVPPPPSGSAAVYLKHSPRQAMDIAVVGVAISMAGRRLSATSFQCQDIRIVLGAVAPTPMRARRAEESLRGHEVTGERIVEAARIAAEEARPIDDVRGSAWYRRRAVEALTRRGLARLAEGSEDL